MPKTISIVLTVFNKEFLIERVVKAILDNSSDLVKQIVVVFDSCTDKSEKIIKTILCNTKYNIIYAYIDQGFETKSNNLGLKQVSCDYSILFQDDMVINEKDYDKRLLEPFIKYDDVFAVTARTAHNDIIVNDQLCYSDYFDKFHGRPRFKFGIRDIVNRGPLMVSQERIQILNYFDEAFCPQCYDDHDLCFRAYQKYGWVCGSFWVDCISNLEWGATRRPEYAQITVNALKHGEQLIKQRYSRILDKKHNEERDI